MWRGGAGSRQPGTPGAKIAHVPRLQRKNFASPDQVRTFPLGRIDIVNLDETTIGRFVWEPGWRWSKDVAPTVHTESCRNRHVGYVISGQLHVVMDDGSDAFLYRSLYVPVDSIGNDAQVADEFDVGTLQVLGLTGWQVIGVIPKTIGVGLENSSIGTTFGTTWGGGMGGNVMGVYLLLRYRVHVSNLAAAEEHMTAFV